MIYLIITHPSSLIDEFLPAYEFCLKGCDSYVGMFRASRPYPVRRMSWMQLRFVKFKGIRGPTLPISVLSVANSIWLAPPMRTLKLNVEAVFAESHVTLTVVARGSWFI